MPDAFGNFFQKKKFFFEVESTFIGFGTDAIAHSLYVSLCVFSSSENRLQMLSIEGQLFQTVYYFGCCQRGWRMGIPEVKVGLYWMEFLVQDSRL